MLTAEGAQRQKAMIEKYGDLRKLMAEYFEGRLEPDEMFDVPYLIPRELVQAHAIERLTQALYAVVRISPAQQKRLFTIATKVGWSREALKALLVTKGYEHSKEILKEDYDKVCSEVEVGQAIRERQSE